MYVCMYVRMYVCMYVCIYIYIYIKATVAQKGHKDVPKNRTSQKWEGLRLFDGRGARRFTVLDAEKNIS